MNNQNEERQRIKEAYKAYTDERLLIETFRKLSDAVASINVVTDYLTALSIKWDEKEVKDE